MVTDPDDHNEDDNFVDEISIGDVNDTNKSDEDEDEDYAGDDDMVKGKLVGSDNWEGEAGREAGHILSRGNNRNITEIYHAFYRANRQLFLYTLLYQSSAFRRSKAKKKWERGRIDKTTTR